MGAYGVEIRHVRQQLAQRRIVEQRPRRPDGAAGEQRAHPAAARLEHRRGVRAEHLVDAEVRPDLLDLADRLLPASDIAREDAGRHGARRRSHDDGKRPVGTRMYLRQRLQHADLERGARAAAGQDQSRARNVAAAANIPLPLRPHHFHGEHHARTSKDSGHRPDRGDHKCMRSDARRGTRRRDRPRRTSNYRTRKATGTR